MKLTVKRNHILLEPENTLEITYIEEVLKLRNDGDTAVCKRRHKISSNCLPNLKEILGLEEDSGDTEYLPYLVIYN